jgi:hypothetical protein
LIDRLICPDKISQDHDTKLFSPRVAALLAGAAAT